MSIIIENIWELGTRIYFNDRFLDINSIEKQAYKYLLENLNDPDICSTIHNFCKRINMFYRQKKNKLQTLLQIIEELHCGLVPAQLEGLSHDFFHPALGQQLIEKSEFLRYDLIEQNAARCGLVDFTGDTDLDSRMQRKPSVIESNQYLSRA